MSTEKQPENGISRNGREPLLHATSLATIANASAPRESAGGVEQPLQPKANIWRCLTFSWLNPLIAEGHKRDVQYNDSEVTGNTGTSSDTPAALTEDDLYELPHIELPHTVRFRIEGAWVQELAGAPGSASLQRALRIAFGRTLIIGGCYKLCYDSLQMVGPFVLKRFLGYLSSCGQDHDKCNIEDGLIWVAVMMVTAIVQTVLLQQYFHCSFRTGMRMNCGAICLIYEKALKLACPGQAGKGPAQSQQRTSGEIVNLMSVDAQRLQDLMTYFCTILSGPYQITITLTFLSFVVGWATLGGVAILLLQIPLMTVVSRRIKKAQIALMKVKDERIKITNEVFGAIRLLKMYGWEDSFEDRVNTARENELRHLRKYQILSIFTTCIYAATPLLTGATTFAMYTQIYGDLDAETAFTALALFNVLRFPLTMFPNVVTSTVEARVALGRIQSFLESPEVECRTQFPSEESGHAAVELKQASLVWPDGTSLLRDVSFSLPSPARSQEHAHLTVIVGAVGSGKSGLLQAVIGDIKPDTGLLMTSGTMAYAAQVAWIRNTTVRDNIIFNSPFDENRYQAILEACCLLPDLEALPNHDQTEIGEKGVNLSGGQKQRIALARAVYAGADLLLLDDVLSAVDAEVANKLLSMLRGPLVAGSSILLCTHFLGAIQHADQVVLLERKCEEAKDEERDPIDANSVASLGRLQYGYVAFCGSADELRRQHPQYVPNDVIAPLAAKAPSEQNVPTKAGVGAGRLVAKEVERVGAVPFSVYKTYVQAAGGITLTCAVVFGVGFGQALQTIADTWVSFWSDHSADGSKPYISSEIGLAGYVAFSFGAFFGIFATSALFRLTALNAARFFHQKLLAKLLHLPVVFFDTEPLGRILNRLSKDIYTIDERLQSTLNSQLQVLVRVVATIVVIAVATPWFLAIVVPLLLVYRRTQNYYIPSSRQLKRIESVLRSPIFSHFSESLDGVSSIRAFGQQNQFIEENLFRLRRNMRAYYLNVSSNRWLAVRLETLGTAIVTAAGLLAVLGARSISAGVAGLSISYALSVTQSLNWCVRMASQREIDVVSVERVHEYIEKQSEPAHRLPNDPPTSWPSAGTISFQNVSVRYRPLLPLVLNGFTLEIRAHEKLGVCGRTGAGKSSVLNTLLRIVEPEDGQVLIDGVDICKIGLHRLRHSISIIPQDPVLFSGTLKFNLDPLGETQDNQKLWQALRRSHLDSHAGSLVSQTVNEEERNQLSNAELEAICLDAKIAEKGQNFSLGQRQQLCLARALLRESNRILLLDEATSSVDAVTDDLIQETLRKEFAAHTVLCIAHRISTIMESDRVCVLEDGRLVELGPPKELREQPESTFRKLAMLDASSTTE